MSGKKWQALIGDAVAGVYPALEAMTDSELRNVRSAKKKATSSNCWWLVARVVPVMSEIAADLLRARQLNRRRNRSKK